MRPGSGAAVELKNPFGDDQSRLRTSLLPGLLAALKRNLDLGAAPVRLFECGRVFSPMAEGSRISRRHWRAVRARLAREHQQEVGHLRFEGLHLPVGRIGRG